VAAAVAAASIFCHTLIFIPTALEIFIALCDGEQYTLHNKNDTSTIAVSVTRCRAAKSGLRVVEWEK
jgi:hypothetical protein